MVTKEKAEAITTKILPGYKVFNVEEYDDFYIIDARKRLNEAGTPLIKVDKKTDKASLMSLLEFAQFIAKSKGL